MRWIVSGITALIMLVIGVFWMITWLIGTNGYNTSTGTAILAANLVLVLLSTIVASVASGWLAKRLVTKTGMSLWIIAPLCVFAVIAVTVAALFIGSIIIIAIAEATR
ncbi:hypothetical protein BH20ACI4_BH20ACI4_18050 [soil metagenome]